MDQVRRYGAKLLAERTVIPEGMAFAVNDDRPLSWGNPERALLAEELLAALGCLSVVVAEPSLPFADFLLRRSPDDDRLIPRDTETRTFLHDIPVIRRDSDRNRLVRNIAAALSSRKGVLVEGIGVAAAGDFTVEQAYVNFCSVFHAVFVKYLQDLLRYGFSLPGEEEAMDRFRRHWLRPLSADGLHFMSGPLDDAGEIVEEMARVGEYVVRQGLVDSFFGNISCRRDGVIYISQTAASLDELAGCIDPVPIDNSSTAGITASSELLAHRKIYEATGGRTILHGHPRFSVIMSMECEESECKVEDCWRDCPKVRYLGDVPVVAGEIGAGGLAKMVPPVIGEMGSAIVYGHGVFSFGDKDFAGPFGAMMAVEKFCREEYFRRLDGRV
jgi:ribulose-5-phosphate 4-epimerase/fuculose-1-phosphate aldolase